MLYFHSVENIRNLHILLYKKQQISLEHQSAVKILTEKRFTSTPKKIRFYYVHECVNLIFRSQKGRFASF